VWFQQALAAAPGSPERGRFIFRAGLGVDGDLPPNNWVSSFGGPAWTRVADGQWYLHLFAAEQPDLNWEDPEVPAEFARIIRFWLDRGADGFRMDVAHGMAKPEDLPDMTVLRPPGDRNHEGDPVSTSRTCTTTCAACARSWTSTPARWWWVRPGSAVDRRLRSLSVRASCT
jgi:glycosidase